MRNYADELINIHTNVVRDLNNIIKDEIDVSEPLCVWAISVSPKVDEVKINRVKRNDSGKIILECKSLTSGENREYTLDEIYTEGLVFLLVMISVLYKH